MNGKFTVARYKAVPAALLFLLYAAPASPAGLSAAGGNMQVTLSWDPINYLGFFIIYQQKESGGTYSSDILISGQTINSFTGGLTSHTVTGLTNGTEYTFRILAASPNGEKSPWSDEVRATPAALPVVTVAPVAMSVSEGVPARFTLTRTGATAAALTVRVTVTEEGSFIRGTAPARAVIPAGEASVEFEVATVDDGIDEPDGAVVAGVAPEDGDLDGETVTVTHAVAGAGSGYEAVAAPSVEVTVTDNDTTLPEVFSATVTDDRLTLTWNRAMDRRFVPSGGDFSVAHRLLDPRVTAVRVSGREVVLTLEHPVSKGRDVTVSYTPGAQRLRGANAGADAAALVNHPVDNATMTKRLFARFDAPTDRHDGFDEPYALVLRFNWPIFRDYTDDAMESVLHVAFGRATAAVRRAGADDVFDVTVAAGGNTNPGGETNMVVRVLAGVACGTGPGYGPCTGDGVGLAREALVTVQGPEGLADMPVVLARHPEAAVIEGAPLDVEVCRFAGPGKAEALEVKLAATDTGNMLEGTKNAEGALEGRLILLEGQDCATYGVVTEDDGLDESHSEVTVRVLAADDGSYRVHSQAVATEGPNVTLDFAVTLDAESERTVTVDYQTGADGDTAIAGTHYTASSGTLTFAPGDTSQTASVQVINDDVANDGAEMTLTLSNPVNGEIEDGVATGTIRNDDPIPQAWIARFGRTVTGQVLDAVQARRDGARRPFDAPGFESREVTDRELLTGSSFALSGGAAGGGEIEASLTGLYPYAGLDLTELTSVWAAAGYGAGDLELEPEGGAKMKTDLSMAMGASRARRSPSTRGHRPTGASC